MLVFALLEQRLGMRDAVALGVGLSGCWASAGCGLLDKRREQSEEEERGGHVDLFWVWWLDVVWDARAGFAEPSSGEWLRHSAAYRSDVEWRLPGGTFL